MGMPPGIDALETYMGIVEKHFCEKAIIASSASKSERVKEIQALSVGA